MTNEQINKTIHEFMGLCWHDDFPCKKCDSLNSNPNYCESLDALRPVWEKMKGMKVPFSFNGGETEAGYFTLLSRVYTIKSSYYLMWTPLQHAEAIVKMIGEQDDK